MAKFLKKSEYDSLKAKADNYDLIVDSIVKTNEELKPEDITPQIIVDAFTESQTESSVQDELDKANGRIKELETENSTIPQLQEQIKNLKGVAAEQPGAISSKSEVGAEPKTLADFGKENAGNTQAILGELKKEGLI